MVTMMDGTISRNVRPTALQTIEGMISQGLTDGSLVHLRLFGGAEWNGDAANPGYDSTDLMVANPGIPLVGFLRQYRGTTALDAKRVAAVIIAPTPEYAGGPQSFYVNGAAIHSFKKLE